MAVLDDLSGHEFEDVMEDVFRNLGYQNVRQSKKTGDEGRDILMEEVVDGTRRAVVVECKHRDTVSRPMVQKLHSAVTTYEYDGSARGLFVTTGRFTDPAREYAAKVGQNGSGPGIELVDGRDLRQIAEDVGLDLRNGRIEILCDETLRPFDPARGPAGAIQDAADDVANLSPTDLPEPTTELAFEPVVQVEAAVEATFETSVGVINRVDTTDQFLLDGATDPPETLGDPHASLVTENRRQTTEIDEERLAERVADYDIGRFDRTETGYKEWAVETCRRRHTETVQYTGDNNVDYEKTCEPNQSDVSVQSVDAVYLPKLRQTVELQGRTYEHSSYRAGPSRATLTDELHECVVCGAESGTHTYCDNCGRIVCASHVTVERLEQEPVCTECSVTERFMLATKHFYDEENRARFEREYEAMPVHEKARENPRGIAVVSVVVLLLGYVAVAGVI